MSEKTEIVQAFLPNLVAGKYTVDIKHDVKHKDEAIQKVRKIVHFGVDAARFTLNSDDIYSVYPPANTTGQYTNHLAHIVFNRRTLPWERTIDGEPPKNQKLPMPWMALLLLNDEDMKDLKIEQRALTDVLDTNQEDQLSRPKIGDKNSSLSLKLMEWETDDQKCLTIDLTNEQYLKYLPLKDDLTYLAHSKKVTIDHKDPNGVGDVEGSIGYFSVLVGNRLIENDKSYTAIVVSLEGHDAYLGRKEVMKEHVRMVVLANWTFNCNGQKSFESLLKAIEVKNMTLKSSLQSGHILEKYIKNSYVPMRHQMRNGAKNISWYRGPFVINKQGFSGVEFIKFLCSDSALYYDSNNGFLDISIASAWELGKIMALNNQEFTKAIVAWNNDPVESTGEIATQTIKKTELIQWLNGQEIKLAVSPHQSNITKYREFPDVVKKYLRSLARLEGIPLSYIIPDLKYIQSEQGNPESLVMFSLDPRWIFALLDGAVCLSRELLTDTKTQVEGIINEVYGFDFVSGFLLHSKLVSGWRGIEIKVFDIGGKLLDNSKKIRFERITPDIFLGIFQGEISKITITQPYEGLHFGVKDNATQTFEKAIKTNDGKISKDEKIELKEFPLLKEGMILGVSKFANSLKDLSEKVNKELKPDEKSETNQVFTSAEFAYQMVDSPIEYSFHIQYSNK